MESKDDELHAISHMLRKKLLDCHYQADLEEWGKIYTSFKEAKADQLVATKLKSQQNSYSADYSLFSSIQKTVSNHRQIFHWTMRAKSFELLALSLILLAYHIIYNSHTVNCLPPLVKFHSVPSLQSDKNHFKNYESKHLYKCPLAKGSEAGSSLAVINQTSPDTSQDHPVVKIKPNSGMTGTSTPMEHFNPQESDDLSFEETTQEPILNFTPKWEIPNPSPSPIQLNFKELNTLEFPKSLAYQPTNLFYKQQTEYPSAIAKPKKFRILLDVGITLDRDLIKSPYPNQLSPHQVGRINGNYGFRSGLTLHNSYLDIHTGLRYHRKDYASVYEGVNQIRVLSIPGHLRLKLKSVGSFQAYVLGGAIAHFVLHANYSETKLIEENPDLFPLENNTKISEPGLFSNADFSNGILEGESLRGNHYFTATMGIGAEYTWDEKWKIFIEQTYDYHMGKPSIGPGFDRFYTTSTLLGLRMSLKSRK